MKHILLIISFILLTLTSCQITEKIYFEENGSGKYNIEIDMSEMMKSLGELNSEKKIDSNYVAKDSIVRFSEMLVKHKDSIAKLPKEKREQLEKIKDIVMIFHEDKNKNELSVSITGAFKNASELSELQYLLNETQDEKKKIPSKSDVKYSFKNNKFSRKSTVKKLNKEELAKYNESMKGFDMFLSGTTYNLEYHFPKPIKNASIKEATFSADKKTLYLKKSINDFINKPNAFDFDVKLKK